MSELEKVIARIEGTHLGYEDHGIFSLNVSFTYGSSAQGTGHYCVCSSKSDAETDVVGIRLVKAIVDACGVSAWEQLKGRTVYVLKDPGWNGSVRGIAPLPTEGGKRVVFADILESQEVPA
jgi:hypothetical protein